MKVLLPISSEQIISILPRRSDIYLDSDFQERVLNSNGSVESSECVSDALTELNSLSMYIRKDGEAIEETLNNLKSVSNGNYVDVYFSSNILEEENSYFIEIKQNGSLFYRDKFYITSKTDFTVKHSNAQEEYSQHQNVDDNTYIIR